MWFFLLNYWYIWILLTHSYLFLPTAHFKWYSKFISTSKVYSAPPHLLQWFHPTRALVPACFKGVSLLTCKAILSPYNTVLPLLLHGVFSLYTSELYQRTRYHCTSYLAVVVSLMVHFHSTRYEVFSPKTLHCTFTLDVTMYLLPKLCRKCFPSTVALYRDTLRFALTKMNIVQKRWLSSLWPPPAPARVWWCGRRFPSCLPVQNRSLSDIHLRQYYYLLKGKWWRFSDWHRLTTL